MGERKQKNAAGSDVFLLSSFSASPPPLPSRLMSRGNQRDVDRARAAARAGKTGKPAKEKDGLTAAQRKERCVC